MLLRRGQPPNEGHRASKCEVFGLLDFSSHIPFRHTLLPSHTNHSHIPARMTTSITVTTDQYPVVLSNSSRSKQCNVYFVSLISLHTLSVIQSLTQWRKNVVKITQNRAHPEYPRPMASPPKNGTPHGRLRDLRTWGHGLMCRDYRCIPRGYRLVSLGNVSRNDNSCLFDLLQTFKQQLSP